MSLTEEERRILVQLELEKARGILGQIDNLMELGLCGRKRRQASRY